MYEIAAIAPEAFKIADRLALLMEEHEPPVTRSELADAIGCARSTISRYCDGTNSVAFIFAIRIARFFNVSLDYLVGLTDSKEIPQWQKPGKHKHSEHWHLKNICKRCYYRREMVGLAGISGFDIEYDNKACHYTFDTGKFREIEATDTECPYFRPKIRERKVVPPAWDKMKNNENIYFTSGATEGNSMRYNDADQTPPVQTTAAQDEQIKQMTATDCINYLFQIMKGETKR